MKKAYLKSFLTVSAFFLISTNAFTQSYKKGFTLNLGFGSEGYGYPDRLEATQTSSVPTINLYGEYFLGKMFSLGVYGAYTDSYDEFKDYYYPSDSYKDSWRGWDAGLRYTLHLGPVLTKNDRTDLYLSAFSGYTSRSLVYDKTNIYRDSLNYSIKALSIGGIIGFRYFVSEHIGLFGEVGLSREVFLGGGITYNIPAKKK